MGYEIPGGMSGTHRPVDKNFFFSPGISTLFYIENNVEILENKVDKLGTGLQGD
jgi:hypothetical protein